MRRVRWAVGLALFMDAALFLAVLPLLPYYSERFDLSTVEAALIVAAYPIMVAVSSIPAGALTGRVGGRRLTIVGSALVTVATVVFAVAPSALVLAGARALQGVSSGISWSAGMAWLTATAPEEARGRVTGGAMAMVSGGAIAGPGIGALAGVTSPQVAFALAALVAAAATVVAVLSPAGPATPSAGSPLATIARMARSPFVVAAVCFGMVDSVVNAVVGLLVPLELGRRGLGATEIGGVMILGAAIGMACGPPAGRLVDRHGALPLGLRAATGMALVPTAFILPLPTLAMLALLVAMNPLFTFLATAMYPPAAEGADRLGVSHGAAYGLLSISWAVGYGVGPLVGAFVAAAGGDAAGFGAGALAAFALVATALRAVRRTRLAVPA